MGGQDQSPKRRSDIGRIQSQLINPFALPLSIQNRLEFPGFLGGSVTPERNLGDKGHLEGETQNTLFPYPAYRLLLTPSSCLFPLPSSLLPSDRSTAARQHRITAVAKLEASRSLDNYVNVDYILDDHPTRDKK